MSDLQLSCFALWKDNDRTQDDDYPRPSLGSNKAATVRMVPVPWLRLQSLLVPLTPRICSNKFFKPKDMTYTHSLFPILWKISNTFKRRQKSIINLHVLIKPQPIMPHPLICLLYYLEVNSKHYIISPINVSVNCSET